MTFQQPHYLLLALPLTVVWWLYLWPAAKSRWLRLAILLLCVLALADPRLPGASIEPGITVLLDRSLSVRGEAVKKGLDILRLLAPKAASRIQVLGFGRGASLLARPGAPLDTLTDLDAQDDSDLSAGLRLAAGLSGAPQELLLISDGLYTGPDPLQEIPALRAQGIRVHTLAVASPLGGDAAITRVLHPTRSAVNQPFVLAVEITSPKPQPARLTLQDRQGNPLAQSGELPLHAGQNRYSFTWQADHVGLQEYSLKLDVADDAVPENNLARTVIDVIGQPGVLVLNQSGQPTALSRALASAGLAVTTRNGDAGPLSSAALHPYAAVVLENMPLERLNDGADAAIAHYVRHLGGGLLVTGGRSSYALGGYYRSALEDLLPVTLDRQDDLRRPRIAMAIVLDRSGSMAVTVAGGAAKIDLANRGAVEAIALLTPTDEVAVFAVDSAAHPVAPLQAIGDSAARDKLNKRILSIDSGGGGIFVYEGLTAAVNALLASTAPTRHIVLFSDAADSEEPGDYQTLIQQWRAAGGSLSVIGLGTAADSDAALLEDIAQRGGGRVYFTANALNLPRVFTQDVMYVARQSFLAQTTPVFPARGLLALDFAAVAIPAVKGYNLGYLAPSAELMLVSGDDHKAPLAAGWQRGQGKVLAVTVEADGPFTGDFATWNEYQSFFRHTLEWLKSAEQETGFAADLSLVGREAVISLELEPTERLAAPPTALIIPPDETKALEIPLHWQGPTTLTGTFTLRSDGVYHGAIALPGHRPLALPPRLLPYSPEFAPHLGVDGSQLLRRLAEATGGQPFTQIGQLTATAATAVGGGHPLGPELLAVGLVLVLVEIGQRRGLWDRPLNRLAAAGRRLQVKLRFRPSTPQSTVRPSEETTPVSPAQAEPASDTVFARAKQRAARR